MPPVLINSVVSLKIIFKVFWLVILLFNLLGYTFLLFSNSASLTNGFKEVKYLLIVASNEGTGSLWKKVYYMKF